MDEVHSKGVGQGVFLGPVQIRSPRTGEVLRFALFVRANGEHFARNLSEVEARVEKMEKLQNGVDKDTQAALDALLKLN